MFFTTSPFSMEQHSSGRLRRISLDAEVSALAQLQLHNGGSFNKASTKLILNSALYRPSLQHLATAFLAIPKNVIVTVLNSKLLLSFPSMCSHAADTAAYLETPESPF